MPNLPPSGLPIEQQVCIQCGFCCDGTLFTHADLLPGEYPNLPPAIRARYQRVGDDESFALGCTYFSGKCTIYEQDKPTICSTFRCKALKKIADGNLSPAAARVSIAKFKTWRQEIFVLYEAIFDKAHPASFWDLLAELPTLPGSSGAEGHAAGVELLIIKCGLLDAAMTKYFKSDGAFRKMLKTEES